MDAVAEPISLPGVPEGLEARPLVRLREGETGELVEVRDRRGRRKADVVVLAAPQPLPPEQAALADADRRFLLGASRRRWSTVVQRYGDRAWEAAVDYARAGAVRLEVPVDEALRLGTPRRWRLTESWETLRVADAAARAAQRGTWTDRAAAAAAAVAPLCPELATALRPSTAARATLTSLVCAAEDLVAGVSHDGPRAFSQTHFGDTKAREGISNVLADAGVPAWVAKRLGVRRSARLGLAGPVTLRVGQHAASLRDFDGPVTVRTDQPGLTVELEHTATLVVVENLQAAEAIADRWPEVALAYTAGQPGGAALRLLGELAALADRTLVVPDADLGGVRIAERLLGAIPRATVVDVGAQPHARRASWASDGAAVAGLKAALAGRAAALAAACLRRGYPVEQEAIIIRAVADHLHCAS